MMPWLSIIVPVLNEAAMINGLISSIRGFTTEPGLVEIIVVDGGSQDESVVLSAGADQVLVSDPGRSLQMNVGARHSRGEVLLFLHADTYLPDMAIDHIKAWASAGGQWGAFEVTVVGQSPWLSAVSAGINLRSRLTGIVTGDQAMYVTRRVFDEEGGFAGIALMEDIELSHRLRKRSWPYLIRVPVRTSGRRWDDNGVFKTMLFMWRLRVAYALGRDPSTLAERYYPRRSMR
tara:strand:+ start:1250 stop:1948 length:699 start_codon:yes stop_codon:yes gene_type:complete